MRAARFVFLMGLVSLLGDVTYEGARSVIGPFLLSLGVSASLLGLIVGAGELSSLVLRLITGWVADKTQRYWLLTFLGYAMILAIPLLAFAGRWEVAALLIILERAGKALRTPSRDALLSYATMQIGRGYGFGLHEALDQIGAIVGPLVVFAALYAGNYESAFEVLFFPAFLCLFTLNLARKSYSFPRMESPKKGGAGVSKVFWLYTAFVFVTTAGLLNFALLSYHFKAALGVSEDSIPLIYALCMGIDAVAAIASGHLYDRIGLKVLALLPLLCTAVLLAFSPLTLLVGIIALGAAIGMQETTMRAAVADLAGREKMGTAYGIFNTVYGVSWFTGSAVLGWLYENSLFSASVFVIALELISLPLLLILIKLSADREEI